ncbi:unnamed protein product [Cylindrotheca closterium]|uniref:Uncharacterized protein n=1 Tax=Cylindrotheca closterium TaxID=2856 RepID=A0AAD2CGH1_9STRA|nr:unnamed protein product [Cylindrotheca closterium]
MSPRLDDVYADENHRVEESSSSSPLQETYSRSRISAILAQCDVVKRSSAAYLSTTDSSSASSGDSAVSCGGAESAQHESPESPPYLFADHCRNLYLKTENTDDHQYWYCDWTNYFVPFNHTNFRNEFKSFPKLENVVKDYCQPFRTHAELQNMYVGLDTESMPRVTVTEGGKDGPEPYAVRTTMIHLRPDAKQNLILQAVHQAFMALHPTYYHIIKSTMHEFQALGGHGTVSLVLVANVVTHKTSLERHLLLRFYHAEQLGEYLTESQLDDDLEIELDLNKGRAEEKKKIKNIVINSREDQPMSPLKSQHTRLNELISEASALVKLVQRHGFLPSHQAPGPTQEETSRILQSKHGQSFTSKSVLSVFYKDVRNLFPSLSTKDKQVLQESHSLMERIWSELEMVKATHNTLITESSSRFGMRPCQPNLDRDFCFHLAQISQHNMLADLAQQMEKAETILHEALMEYADFEAYLKQVMLNDYLIRLNNSKHKDKNKFNPDHSLDMGQAPIHMKKRKMEEFPWDDEVRRALDKVAHQVAANCLEAFRPKESLQMSIDATHRVFVAFGKADDQDQSQFLKKLSRRNMIKVTQQQARVKLLLEKIILLPHSHPHIPRVKQLSNHWYELTLQSKTSNIRRGPIPILNFQTKFGGQGCITSHQLILVKGVFRTEVLVWDWMDIDLAHTPDHPFAKVVVLENGKRISGFNPLGVDPAKIVKMAQTLKGLQE